MGATANFPTDADAQPAATPTPAQVGSGTEIVDRPQGGIQRGLWAAPSWAFYAAAALVVLVASLYAARRLGLLHGRK